MDALNGILIALKLKEKSSADGASASGVLSDDAYSVEDLESLKKEEKTAAVEKDAEPQLPQRPNEPDCSFYIDTGRCKYGLNCKFNHPVQKRILRIAWTRMMKSSDANVQAAKDEKESSGLKMIGQTTWKNEVENKMGNRFKRMVETEKKVVVKQTPRQLEQKDHKNVEEKPKGTLLEKVGKTEKKEEKQNPSVRIEQETHNVKLKKRWKAVQVEKEEEVTNNVVQAKSEAARDKQSSPQRMKQDDNKGVKEKQIPSDRMQHQHNKVEEKEKEVENNVVQAKSEVVKDKQSTPQRMNQKDDKVVKEKQIPSDRMQRQHNQVVKDKQSPNQRMKQEDNKGVKQKRIPSVRMQHQDNKAAERTSRETTAEKVGVIECKYHMMPGGCKYGKSCKYVHSQKKKEVVPVHLNFVGLPIRPGEKECSYYMRTGSCKHAANCKYHHPDPTETPAQQDPPGCQSSQSMQQIGFGASPLPMMPNPSEGPFHVPTSFMIAPPTYSPGSNLHPQSLHSNSECNDYQVHAVRYPERSGQPECQQFLNFGVCQFGSNCPLNHPRPHHIPANSSGTFRLMQ